MGVNCSGEALGDWKRKNGLRSTLGQTGSESARERPKNRKVPHKARQSARRRATTLQPHPGEDGRGKPPIRIQQVNRHWEWVRQARPLRKHRGTYGETKRRGMSGNRPRRPVASRRSEEGSGVGVP